MGEHDADSKWLAELRAGDERAVGRIVDEFHKRLVAVARAAYRDKFSDVARPADGSEDAALSAEASVAIGMRKGEHSNIADREHLFRLLAQKTIFKIYDQRERATAKKRAGGRSLQVGDIEQLVSRLPDPQKAAEIADAIESLDDSGLRSLARIMLECPDMTRKEIAAELVVTERTVYRMLNEIKRQWECPSR